MNSKRLIPQPQKPVFRVIQGTQVDPLAELSEDVLTLAEGTGVSVSQEVGVYWVGCAYDGDADE